MSGLTEFQDLDVYHRPTKCPECGGIMKFKGCGEYRCEDCRYVEYDDYGKVRNYVETHAGVTAAQVASSRRRFERCSKSPGWKSRKVPILL